MVRERLLAWLIKEVMAVAEFGLEEICETRDTPHWSRRFR